MSVNNMQFFLTSHKGIPILKIKQMPLHDKFSNVTSASIWSRRYYVIAIDYVRRYQAVPHPVKSMLVCVLGIFIKRINSTILCASQISEKRVLVS